MAKKIKAKATRKSIIEDIQRIASEIKRAPNRDEYFGRFGKPMGVFTENDFRKLQLQYQEACALSGFKSNRIEVTDEAGLEIAKLKAEIKSTNEYVKELEAEAMSAKAIRRLIGAADTTKLGEGADWLRGPRQLKDSVTGIPTLFLSDIHFDEVVKPEEVNYVNEYNHDIAVERIKHTFQKAIDMTKLYMVKPKYDGFICALGGDMFSGNIHEELAETNDQVIMKSVLDLFDLLADGLHALADEFGRVFVPAVVGNHGRTHKKPRYKQGVHHNYEWLLYQLLARHFKGDTRLTFLVPDSFDAQWQCYGRTYNLNHGDQFSGGTGISGIFTPLMLGMARKQKRQNAVGQPFDVMMNGHWHQYIKTDYLVVNGSVKGYDEFAFKHNFNYEPPQQALFISHPTKRETFAMPIWCDKETRLGKKAPAPLSW